MPRGFSFTVFAPLCETTGKSHQEQCESVYVIVDRIADGKIYGRVNNRTTLIRKYQIGDRVQFPESRIQNWVVLRPDGSEEANELGNFLDHWRPPK